MLQLKACISSKFDEYRPKQQLFQAWKALSAEDSTLELRWQLVLCPAEEHVNHSTGNLMCESARGESVTISSTTSTVAVEHWNGSAPPGHDRCAVALETRGNHAREGRLCLGPVYP